MRSVTMNRIHPDDPPSELHLKSIATEPALIMTGADKCRRSNDSPSTVRG